jgi:Domain of unknown function (DUF4272)
VAWDWLATHGLQSSLTDEEEAFVRDGVGEKLRFQGSIESLWALAWMLGVVPQMNWNSLCSNDFIKSFPDPRSGGLASPISSAALTVSANQLWATA